MFSDVYERRVLRPTWDKHFSLVLTKNKGSGGLAVHKDGRIFIAGVGDLRGPGSIVGIGPDGSNIQAIVSREAGYLPNDLVFDAKLCFYFTDFCGASTDAKAWRLLRLAGPEDGYTCTAIPLRGEWSRTQSRRPTVLHDGVRQKSIASCCLSGTPTQIAIIGTAVTNHLTGAAPESMRIWPDNLMKRYIKPVARANGIYKNIGWHTFRHTFGTLLKASGEDVRTVQVLLRYANSRITLDV